MYSYSVSNKVQPISSKSKTEINSTGIDSLDKILEGGFPSGSTILLAGSSGSGKTILSQQWLFEGYNKFEEPGIYISLTELLSKSLTNVKQFEFYNEDAVGPMGIHFTDLRSISESLSIEDKKDITLEDIEELLDLVENLVKRMGAKRIVLDSITAFLYRLDDRDLIRTFIFKMNSRLSPLNATILMTSEVPKSEGYSAYGVEEFISDGIIQLTNQMGEQSMIRRLQVVKMRGREFRSAPVVFDITNKGLEIYPKIPIDRSVAKTNYEKRRGTGIKDFDSAIDGGYPEGHLILIGGNTGTGKTTFGMHFLVEGINDNEKGLFVSLEESVEQVKKSAESFGWDLNSYHEEGSLSFLNPSLIDIYPDKLLFEIAALVKEEDVDRVFIDSISSLLSSTLNKNAVREFLLQLSSLMKSTGTTLVMSYMTDKMFFAGNNQLLGKTEASQLRLSSIADGIILLRYVERDDEVKKLMTVLKMRGVRHDTDIKEYSITEKGISLKGKFKAHS